MILSFQTQQTPEVVFDYLSDMEKFVSVHPIIYKIESKGDNLYLIHEKLKIGFIPYEFTYPAIVEKNDQEKTITMKAEVKKMVKIEMKFKINSSKGITHVEEKVKFESFLPVKFLLEHIFRKQHAQLFNNINAIR